MREKGVPSDAADSALDTLPDTFAEWAGSLRELATGVKTVRPTPVASPAGIEAITTEVTT
jgi:hypothetical protein